VVITSETTDQLQLGPNFSVMMFVRSCTKQSSFRFGSANERGGHGLLLFLIGGNHNHDGSGSTTNRRKAHAMVTENMVILIKRAK
jgi:hypothetical protein